MTQSDLYHPMLKPADKAEPEEQTLSWAERAVPRRLSTVKCRRCGTVNTADDPWCVGCRVPLGLNPALLPTNRGRRAARWGLVALALGAGLGPILGDGMTLVARTPRGPNVN